ncbi:MAG: hypothetical protein MUF00_21350, partial [Gemmatimonadaceae bacterium]|nr:hypothetical protein [Gemmatimonadaceae bacterium]
LASLRDVTDRFDDTEVDWERLYLCQLLRLEFPAEAHRLASDVEALKELQSGKPSEEMVARVNERASSADTAVNPFNRADLRHAPGEKHPDRRSRFRTICEGLRDRGSFLDSALDLAQMFRILEHPPVLTWREYSGLWETLESLLVSGSSNDATRAVRNWLDTPPAGEAAGDASPRSVSARVSELFRRTVQAREGQIELAVNQDTVAALTAQLAEVDPFTALLRLIAIDLGGFRNGDLGADEWNHLIGHFGQWAHFDRPAYHMRVRRTEWQLLLDVASEVQAKVAATLLYRGRDLDDWGPGLRRSARHGRRPPAWPRLLDKVYARLGASAAEAVLGAFAQPAGVRALFRADAPEARLLFDPESVLHRGRARTRLLGIARRAIKDDVLRENVAAYFGRLTYGAFGGGFGTRSSLSWHDCKRLLSDHVLVAALWRAVVARPLNPRSAGSLRETRRHLLAIQVPEADLRLPAWFRALERSGFWTDATEESGDEEDNGNQAVAAGEVPFVTEGGEIERFTSEPDLPESK